MVGRLDLVVVVEPNPRDTATYIERHGCLPHRKMTPLVCALLTWGVTNNPLIGLAAGLMYSYAENRPPRPQVVSDPEVPPLLLGFQAIGNKRFSAQ